MTHEGVALLFFDLPMKTAADKRGYRLFRKYLKNHGYMPLQESVYMRHIRNLNTMEQEARRLKENAPKDGSILLLPVTFREMAQFITITGESPNVEKFCAPVLYF